MLILVILISTSIETCFANVSGGGGGGGIWMGLSRKNNKKGDSSSNQRRSSTIHPVALGLQRALSRPGILQHAAKSKSKSIATVASTATASSSNNNSKLREREFYDHGVDEEARATRFAFIDHSEEASEIALTMKPHLKHISSPSESLSSSLEQASSSSFMIKRRSQSSSIATNAKTTQMTSATSSSSTNNEDENTTTPRGGSTAAATTAAATAMRPLYFWESMVSGAVSRSIAQTVMHPANTMKTMMQSTVGPSRLTLRDLIKPQMFRRLSVGAGANFILSLPQ